MVKKAIKSVGRAIKLIENKQDQGEFDMVMLGALTDAENGLVTKQAEAEIEGGGHNWFFVCGECHTALSPSDKYCRQCGREIVWT